ncbi:MAG: hypothetical protein P8X96_02075 [Desulfobacteraceae bacterium]|jgi:hypothetical protein
MLRNKIVAHFKNHQVAKGISNNFFPNKIFFNLEAPTGESSRIDIEQLKAVFFTKDFDGNKDHQYSYNDEIPGAGRKIKVEFFDGEVIVGYSLGYSSDRQGFFLTPADTKGNNERIFVVNSSTTTAEFV